MPLNNVPQAGQSLLQTRDAIANNFTTIDTAFTIDHVSYNNANQGKHNQITFPAHTGSLPFVAGEIGLFNQNQAPTGKPDIWLQRGVSAPYPMTGYDFTGSLNNTVGWSYLPSGLKIIWGRNTITAGGQRFIQFANAGLGGIATFPGFSSFVGCPTVTRFLPSVGTTSAFMVVQVLTLTDITVNSSDASNGVQFYWSVIGM